MNKKSLLLVVLVCFLSFHEQHAMEVEKTPFDYSKIQEKPLQEYFEKVEEAAQWLRHKIPNVMPKIMMVLTSGVNMPPSIEIKETVLFKEIPNFPVPIECEEGHDYTLVFGKMNGVDVVCMNGRLHYFQKGWRDHNEWLMAIVFPYFVMHKLGMEYLIMANTTGAIRSDLKVGDVMLITDQYNGMKFSVAGLLAHLGNGREPFADMRFAYTPALQEIARKKAKELGIELQEGIYAGLQGPQFETDAEVRELNNLGIGTVSLSLIQEMIACAYMEKIGDKVNSLALSGVSNLTGENQGLQVIDHAGNFDAMKTIAGPKMTRLIEACVSKIILQEYTSKG